MRELFLRIRDWIEDAQGDPQRVRVLIVAGVLVLGLVVLVTVFNAVRQNRPAQWSSTDVIEGDAPLQEVLVASAARGGPPPHTEIDLTSIGSIVIAVDLDRVRDRAMYFDAVILDAVDAEVFRDEIDEEFVRDGRFLLELRRRHFPAGDYTIEIEGRDQGGIVSVLARGTFKVYR
jgi:hypothetical protein